MFLEKKSKKVLKSTEIFMKVKGDVLWKVLSTFLRVSFFYLWQVEKVLKALIYNIQFSWWNKSTP